MDDDRRCAARNRRGERCGRAAIVGGTVCTMHGGASPQVKARAERRLAEQGADREAVSLLARLGDPAPLRHPVEELLALGAEVREWQRVVRERMVELRDLARTDRVAALQESATVALYERSLDRCGKLLTDLAHLDLDARLVRLQEAEAQLVAQVLAAALTRARIPTEWRASINNALAAELRALPA